MLQVEVSLSDGRIARVDQLIYYSEYKIDGNAVKKAILEQQDHFFDNLSGRFLFILVTDDEVIIVSDLIRSTRVLYKISDQKILITDDVNTVQFSKSEISMESIKEFEVLGYITDHRTLVEDVHQNCAGEIIRIDRHKGMVRRNFYTKYLHLYENQSEDDLIQELDLILLDIFKDIKERYSQYQYVIPLSGGLDSRLIVMMLKRVKVENVLCFTYGSVGNQEASISRNIAEMLNLPWYFVEYNRKIWSDALEDIRFLKYFHGAGGLSSTPHMQDWPAVLSILDQGLLEDRVVFVPGHSADLPAGSRSAYDSNLYRSSPFDAEFVIDRILKFNYVNGPLYPDANNQVRNYLVRNQNYLDNADAFELWDVSERQAKYIVNSIRLYEFFGYEVTLPFWDKRFAQFWRKVPLEMRRGKKLYKAYLNYLYRLLSMDLMETSQAMTSRKTRGEIIKKVLRPLKIHADSFRHPLKWYDILPLLDVRRRYHITRWYSDKYLTLLKNNVGNNS